MSVAPDAYVELAARSNFSFLEGASHPEELVRQAADFGQTAIAICDRNSIAGAVRAHVAAKEVGVRAILGARLVFDDGAETLCLPEDLPAYQRLCRLLTLGRRRAPKGECRLGVADAVKWGAGMVFVVLPPDRSDGADDPAFRSALAHLAGAFPGAVFVGAAAFKRGDDQARIAAADGAGAAVGAPLVAVGDVLCHVPTRRRLQDLLTCVRHGVTIDRAGTLLEANAERHLKSAAARAAPFAGRDAALARTRAIAERCRFSLDELRYDYPLEDDGSGRTPQERLVDAVWDGAAARYGGAVPERIAEHIRRELDIVETLGYAAYFLTVYEIVEFAKAQNILCQGRGSAANSAICYMLGITALDPANSDLLFERFISVERGEPPDIDVDFEHERREEVIQHIYRKYTREQAGLAATVIRYRARGAVRDVGKALGLSPDVVGALAGTVWGWSAEGVDPDRAREAGVDPADPRVAMTLALSAELIGFPRHLSQHVGGFVITRGRLDELCPVENAAMADRTVVCWDKDDLEALGVLKIDILALGMLTALRKGFDLIADHGGPRYGLADVPQDEKDVYDMLSKGDSIGVFQVESRAQMNMLPRLKPRCYYDLVIQVAIVRPGPIQGDMVHPYLRRRDGYENAEYPSPELEDVLSKTFGVPLFQEQAMQIAIVAADFTPAQADGLRRAMATFRKVGLIERYYAQMVEGMVAKGYDRDFAERCFKQIEGFGSYGFPESHAASFALLVYASAWMKHRHPAAFAAALLNSQPMGFYAPAQLVRDARDHGVVVRPIDVNASDWDCALEAGPDGAPALRLGFRLAKGVSEAEAEKITSARGNGYGDPYALRRRAGVSAATLERLAEADAFAGMGLSRREALWAARRSGASPGPLFDHLDADATHVPEPAFTPPAELSGEAVAEDYASARLSLKAHPLALARPLLPATVDGRPLLTAAQIGDIYQGVSGRRCAAAGIVVVRQRPGSAKGVVFVTIDDETGAANLVVWPGVFEQVRRPLLSAKLLLAVGKLQREGMVAHLVVEKLIDRTDLLAALWRGEGAEVDFPIAIGRGDEARRPNEDRRSDAQARLAAARRGGRAFGHPRLSGAAFPSRDFH